MRFRKYILNFLNSYFPADIQGDARVKITTEKEVSCVINFYGRTDLLRNILAGLREQDLDKEKFEIVLVEDRNGTDEGIAISEEFSRYLNIKYIPLEKNFGRMGYSRNTGIENSSGEYILFLDDDTVILQKDFLSRMLTEFRNTAADAILPRGNSSFCVLKSRYQYHDPHFPTNRCVAYTRKTVNDLGGFISEIVGQEDVEFTVRLILGNKKLHNSEILHYYHPPLIVENGNKAKAVGYSFARLRNRYPCLIWMFLILNGSRFLPLIFFPFNAKCINQARFSLGFIKGVFYSFAGNDVKYGSTLN